jgi:hypothetical protein
LFTNISSSASVLSHINLVHASAHFFNIHL